MRKRLLYPSELWFFLGRELYSMGSISKSSLSQSILNEPAIRWLLLENEEWETYCSQIDFENPNSEDKSRIEEKLETMEFCNIFVKETMKRKKASEQLSEI